MRVCLIVLFFLILILKLIENYASNDLATNIKFNNKQGKMFYSYIALKLAYIIDLIVTIIKLIIMIF